MTKPDREFEWNFRKSESNKRKHGIGLPLAMQVFNETPVEKKVESDEHREIRWQTIGRVARTTIRVTSTTREEGGGEIDWMISARKATRNERRAYEQNP